MSGYQITEMQTTGDNPGWIFGHQADLDADGIINIRGGEIIQKEGDRQKFRRSLENFTLDIRSWTWRRTTNRNWHQFSILQENGGLFVLDRRPKPHTLLPNGIEHVGLPCEGWDGARILIDGVPVSLNVGVSSIDVIVEGNLSPEKASRLAEEIRLKAESVAGSRCVIER